MSTGEANRYLAYVGTYTRGESKSKGVYLFELDAESGELAPRGPVAELNNPSFVAIDPSNRFLYAVNEVNEYGGERGGAVSAFAIDRSSGQLEHLNTRPTGSTGPCHVTIDRSGRYAIVANYAGGAVTMLPIERNGSLGETCDFIQHQGGSNVVPSRQAGPHAHSAIIDQANHFVFVADLGLDRIMTYVLDLEAGKLRPADEPWTAVGPGQGPRHFDFHPGGEFCYVINEIGSTITAFTYDSSAGTLAEIETVPALPEGFSGRSSTADIHVSPSGGFLYGSNRGHDSIVIYEISQATGGLTYVGHESTRGKTPRNFALTPAGDFLFAENQDSDSIVTFAVDAETGRLTATGQVTEAPMPVCLKFVPIGS